MIIAMKAISVKFLFFVFLFTLSGCKPAISPLFSDTTCEAPCWRNIYPGETSKDELISILENMEDIESNRITFKGGRWKIYDDIVYFTLPKNIEVKIYILENKVVNISFSREKLARFSEALEIYGNPDYILNLSAHGEGFLFESALHELIFAVQPAKGVMFGYDNHYVSIFQKENINPRIWLRWIDYFDPARYEGMVNAGFFTYSTSFEDVEESIRPWNGYGSLEELFYP